MSFYIYVIYICVCTYLCVPVCIYNVKFILRENQRTTYNLEESIISHYGGSCGLDSSC